MVGKCEIYQNKKSQDIPGFDEKFLSRGWGLMNVENYKIQQAQALAGFLLVAKVCRLRIGFLGQIILQ